MEKNKEVKQGSMSTRRRHRITSVRDSLDGDREVLNENKRIKVERLAVKKRFNREEEDYEGADVDSADEEDNRRISPANSSISSHSNRRPARGSIRSPSASRIIDEIIIGAPVPRKARSASSKRLHENWSLGEEQGHRKFSPLDVASSSSQSGSIRNKKKKSMVKTRFSSTSTKSFSPIQNDIEIEVAEALFDLMNRVDKVADDRSICSPNGANGKEAISIESNLIEMKADNEEAPKMEIERCLIKADEAIELRKEESVGKAKEVPAHEDIYEESGKSSKLNDDNPVYSASSKAKADGSSNKIEKMQETKFNIDLKKQTSPPPPTIMSLSPKGESLFSYPQIVMQDVQMKGEKVMLNEESIVGKKMEGSEMFYQERCGNNNNNNNKPQEEVEKEPIQLQAHSLGEDEGPSFSLSKPRRKRCVRHEDIASNIKLHQSIIKKSLPVKLDQDHVNDVSLGQDMMNENTSQGLQSFCGYGSKDNVKEVMLQQVQTPNMLQHGHQATMFQVGQQINHQSGGASQVTSSGTPILNFSHTNMPSNAAAASASPYMTIFQNNGYPISFSTTNGGPPQNKGGGAVMMPFFNGSYYTSPMFHNQTVGPNNNNTYYPHHQTPMMLHQSEKHQHQHQHQQASLYHSAGKAAAAESNQKSQKSNSKQQFNQVMPPPPQAFGLSFSSASSNTPSGFQILPDMSRQTYQFAPGGGNGNNKNFQLPEEKKGNNQSQSQSQSQSRNGSKSNSSSSTQASSNSTLMGTAVIDSSGRTVSFVHLPNSNSNPSSFLTTTTTNNNNNNQIPSSHSHSHLKYLPGYQVSSLPFQAHTQAQQQLIQAQAQTTPHHIAFGNTQQFSINPNSSGPTSEAQKKIDSASRSSKIVNQVTSHHQFVDERKPNLVNLKPS